MNSQTKYIIIASTNRIDTVSAADSARLDLAKAAGLRIEHRVWNDNYTNATGTNAIISKKAWRRLPSAVRSALIG